MEGGCINGETARALVGCRPEQLPCEVAASPAPGVSELLRAIDSVENRSGDRLAHPGRPGSLRGAWRWCEGTCEPSDIAGRRDVSASELATVVAVVAGAVGRGR